MKACNEAIFDAADVEFFREHAKKLHIIREHMQILETRRLNVELVIPFSCRKNIPPDQSHFQLRHEYGRVPLLKVSLFLDPACIAKQRERR